MKGLRCEDMHDEIQCKKMECDWMELEEATIQHQKNITIHVADRVCPRIADIAIEKRDEIFLEQNEVALCPGFCPVDESKCTSEVCFLTTGPYM